MVQPNKERVAVIGGGGREAALIDKYLQSSHVASAIAIPGNDMMKIKQRKPVEIFPKLRTTDVKEIVKLCREKKITLVDVAQDNAVHAGVVDALQRECIPTLGPTRLAGQIEWSKAFARMFGIIHDLPQPEFCIFGDNKTGIDYLKSTENKPRFIKVDELCEGKGALHADNTSRAIERINELSKIQKNAKGFYLIEEWLKNSDGSDGEEFSTFVISDGERFVTLGSAQDHKRVNNFDTGENTGGTGCSAPPLVLTAKIQDSIDIIFSKTIDGLRAENKIYKGILYLGGILIKEKKGIKTYVVEFNARWGDPEAQVILPGIKNDLFELSMLAVEGNIKELKLRKDNKARVVIAGMAKGYPGNYDAVTGKQIFGLGKAMKMEGAKVYGAGVKIVDGKYYASGGRLFYIVGEGRDVIEARKRAYSAMALISIDGDNLHYRTDIGWRDVNRLIRKR